LKTIPIELNRHELSSGTIRCCIIPAPLGKSIVVSFPAGAIAAFDIKGVFPLKLLEPVAATEIGGLTSVVAGLDTVGFGSCVSIVVVLIPLDADVDVDGTEATMICSPFVIGIVET
jgi:hypothetical protein